MQETALHDLLRQYDEARDAYIAVCTANPEKWHRANTAELGMLFRLLLPYARAGDSNAQYAVASILYFGMLCETEQDYINAYQSSLSEATTLWQAAARQGHLGALDNLLTSGVGSDVDRLRRDAMEVEADHPELISWSAGMPSYSREYFLELLNRAYGPASTSKA